ncbi:MAG TPA: acyl-CoA dehydrogenase family protein [Actinomycetota bacterium]|nr:acyl-CoA dehydrogenase family protein [Actinomycetota bacterium]
MGNDLEREILALAHDFAEREIRPVAAEHDRTEEFPWDVYRKAAEVGLTAYDLPEAYGGGGVESVLLQARVSEELSWGDGPIANAITSNGFFAGPIVAMGAQGQCERWVRPLAGPEPPLCGLAITEPEAGSDASAIATRAERTGGGYRLSGTKTWISGAPLARWYLVFATVAPGTRSKGITAFVLEQGDVGFTLGERIPKLGSRCYPAGELFLQDCVLPEDRRIGQEGSGFSGLMRWFEQTRVTLAASAIGIGRAALEYAVGYAKEREAFGKKIHEFQAVSFRLVDARAKLDQARLMTHHAARLADAGDPFGTESSMAKLAASEAAWFSAWAAVQTLGGWGYSREYPVEKWLRDAKLEEIWEGTSDIQRLIIARSIFRD